MRKTFAIMATSFAIAAQAQAPAPKEPWPEGVDATFTFLAKKIEARSIENCDPAVDVPELSAKRLQSLELKSLRASGERSPLSLMTAMTTANAGVFNVCFDTRLQGSGYAAVVYAGNPRIIAVNPEQAARAEAVFARGYDEVKAIFSRYGEGKLTEMELNQPVGLHADTAQPAVNPPPAEAPRRQPEYRR